MIVEVRQTEAFARWMRRLRDPQAVARIQIRIRRVSLGNFGDIKPVGEGVSELRVDYGPGYRVYLFRKGPTLVLLLGGGTKKTQQSDIAKAKLLAQEADDGN